MYALICVCPCVAVCVDLFRYAFNPDMSIANFPAEISKLFSGSQTSKRLPPVLALTIPRVNLVYSFHLYCPHIVNVDDVDMVPILLMSAIVSTVFVCIFYIIFLVFSVDNCCCAVVPEGATLAHTCLLLSTYFSL